MKKIIINSELIYYLMKQIEDSVFDSLEEESEKFPYILGFSECLTLLKEKYKVDIDIKSINDNIQDKMIKELLNNFDGFLTDD